jgi:hypothetical protein
MTVHIRFEVEPAEGPSEDLRGRAKFVNEGATPVAFLPMQFESASLALEIVDDNGDSVPLPPPPVPDPTARPLELDPGQTYEVAYPGFLPDWIEPGHYRVRARFAGREPAVSEWFDVTVVG